MEKFRFTIALSGDPESMGLLRELSSQVARAAAGLDESGARRASDELVDAIEHRRHGAIAAPVNVSFEWVDKSGAVDVKVTGEAESGSSGGDDRADVRRWGHR